MKRGNDPSAGQVRRRPRRKPARRRFHALQLDVLFVVSVVAMILAHVSRRVPDGPVAALPAGRESAPETSFAFSPEELAPEEIFEPDSLVLRGRAGAAGISAPEAPRDLALAPSPPPALRPVRAARLRPPSVPLSVAKPSFPAAETPFSKPLPPIGPVGDGTGAANDAEVFVFRPQSGGPAAVFVNAPGVPLAGIPALEREAAALDSAAPATSSVVRAVLPAAGTP